MRPEATKFTKAIDFWRVFASWCLRGGTPGDLHLWLHLWLRLSAQPQVQVSH